jgi:hypothetical protein
MSGTHATETGDEAENDIVFAACWLGINFSTMNALAGSQNHCVLITMKVTMKEIRSAVIGE